MPTHANPLLQFPRESWEEYLPPELEVRLSTGTPCPKARIATDLKRLADPEGYDWVRAGTTISVVGNDLPSAEDLEYDWLKVVLPEWMGDGAQVRYFALNPSKGAQQNLRDLAARFPVGRLMARTIPDELDPTSHEAKLVRLWQRFHFTVFENEPQLWIELDHPPGSMKAFDCKHFNPQQSIGLPLYEQCRTNFELLFNKGRDFLHQ